MRKPLFLKIFSGFSLLLLLLSVLIVFFSSRAFHRYYQDGIAQQLSHTGNMVMTLVAPLLKEDPTRLDDFVKDIGKAGAVRITIIDPQGVILADSERDITLMDNHRLRPEFIESLRTGKGAATRFSDTTKKNMFYVALPLKERDAIKAVVRTSMYLERINVFFMKVNRTAMRSAFGVLLLGLVIALLFARNVSLPIKELCAASHRIAQGDFKTKVYIRQNDELQDLAKHFNRMSEQLGRSFAELAQQKEELNNVLSAMKESVMVLDATGKIGLVNTSLQDHLVGREPAGRFYWEVMQVSKFHEMVKACYKTKQACIDEFEWDGKQFVCSVSPCITTGGIVVVLHDMTQLKQIETIKKDFVSNVSHELRTPLAAIKGFVETLESEKDSTKQQRYVDIIKKHTDRLIAIVSDLLTLSELEQAGGTLSVENCTVESLLKNMESLFGPRAHNKGIEFVCSTEIPHEKIVIDVFKVEQALINLIDNALKYTEEGRVTVAMSKTKNSFLVEVTDTGLGIPIEHRSRIFERFYVVDKSRSKKLGGTGLGLSIVKHIVNLHKGTITISSVVGQGSTFTMTFPQ